MPRQINQLKECIRKTNTYNNETICFLECIAATIMGVKPASLVNVKSDQCIELLNDFCQNSDEICFSVIKDKPSRKQVIVYHAKCLSRVLADQDKARYLQAIGYPMNKTLQDIMNILVKKLRSDHLPHELGVFMGYPLKDVCGFAGEVKLPYRKTMGWKMYGDTEISEKLYRQFEYARAFVGKVIRQDQIQEMNRSAVV